MHSLGTGTDGITDSPYLGKDVIVTATRGIHGAPISELAFLQMLAFARDFRRIERQRGEKKWERYPGTLLDGKTVGILGVGAIAEGLAPRCKAFGMRVVGISRTNRAGRRASTRSTRAPRWRRPWPSSTISCCCVPLEDDTRNIVNDRVLAAMKPTAFLINLARGGVLDEAALIRALNEQEDRGRGARCAGDRAAAGRQPALVHAERHHHARTSAAITTTIRATRRVQFEQSLAHFAAGRPELMLHREKR